MTDLTQQLAVVRAALVEMSDYPECEHNASVALSALADVERAAGEVSIGALLPAAAGGVKDLESAVEHLRSCRPGCLGRDTLDGHYFRDEMIHHLSERARRLREAIKPTTEDPR